MLQTLKVTAPNIDAALVISTGATETHHLFEVVDLTAILGAYMIGIKAVFAFSLASSALAVLVCLAIPLEKLPEYGSKKEGEKMTAVWAC